MQYRHYRDGGRGLEGPFVASHTDERWIRESIERERERSRERGTERKRWRERKSKREG